VADKTTIEWTNLPGFGPGASWNPIRGCEWASPGCDNCYARTFAERWRGIPGHAYEQGFDLRLVPELLDQPLRWKRPRGIFTNSMSDLFQRGVPDEFALAVLATMAAARDHVFMTLTKRAARMARFFRALEAVPLAARTESANECFGRVARREGPAGRHTQAGLSFAWTWPLPNAWWGVSVDDRKNGLPRIRQLRLVPAAVRFLSIEPLLEDLGDDLDLSGIDWVIIGGESGPKARSFDLGWARRIVDQAVALDIPVFVKQLGDDPVVTGPRASEGALVNIRTRKAKDMDEWPADLQIREYPKTWRAA
jgi:protein gp37